MSIYKKLATIQCNLLKKDIKKSGYNKHKNFHYHELEDLIPPIFEECMKQEITLVFTFVENAAILKLHDWNSKDEISVRITQPELVVPEKNPNNKLIQDCGANVTYLKRYLLVNTFLITEKEVIDSDNGGDVASSAKNTKKSSAKKSESKKEPETVREDLNLQELLDKALTTLQKKGLTNEEITAYAVKKCIQKMDKFNKKELAIIYDFVNEYFKEGASK